MSAHARARRTRRVSVVLLALVAVVLVGSGVGQLARSGPATVGAAPSTDPAPSPGASTPSVVAAAPPREVRAPWRPGAPRRVTVPTLGVDAEVVPVQAAAGRLVPPADPRLLGWWAPGARAGDARGTTLVAGHTVRGGGGALDRLEEVRRGDRVVVGTGRQRIGYRVTDVRTLSKAALAREATRLFSQESAGQLVLVTCEDWDGAGYRSNVVVTARPEGAGRHGRAT